ncbi:MAG: sugar ABC transporter ATP-binding protein [Actinomycetota bacterium]
MTVLSARGVSKAFPGVQALSEVGLGAESGEVVGVLGVNGAGKSTLMSILGGLVHADDGEILLDGAPISPQDPAAAARLGIALIHQEPSISPTMTVLENLFATSFPTRHGLLDRSSMRERANRVLDHMGVTLDLDEPGSQLSQAQRQLVEIARALLANPRVVIFDEPTSSLDDNERQALFSLIRELKDGGAVVLYITHFIDEVFTVCDRVVVLRDGRNAGEVGTQEVTHDDLIRLIVGDEVVERPRDSRIAGETALRVRDLRAADSEYGWSFDLAEGEIVGLWGLLGSGRSTLLRCLIGLHPTAEAELEVRDATGAMVATTPRALFRRSGYVPEDRHRQGLALSLSVRANLTISALGSLARLGWVSSAEEAAAVTHAIQAGGIKVASSERPVSVLSGGNQQKVVLNRHIIREPRFWMLDEPTRGLDVGARGEVHDSIAAMADAGATVLMVTSDVDELLQLSDRVLVLSRHGDLTSRSAGVEKDELMRLAQASRSETVLASRSETVAREA